MNRELFYCMRYYITYRCNSRCSYCNVWQDDCFRNVKELDLEQAKSLIRQCHDVGIRYIDFTGGEPTLSRNLVPLICYAKELGIKTEVTSNGIAHQNGCLHEAAECADKFNISLDTLDPDVYRKVRGIDKLNAVLEALKDIVRIREPKLMTVISDENISELKEMVKFAQMKNAEIYLNPVFSYFDASNRGKTQTYISRIVFQTYEPYTVVMLHFMEFLSNIEKGYKPPCSANKRTLTFAPDGGLILPCYHAIRETIPWNGNLSEILESSCFRRYAEVPLKEERCKQCAVVPYFGISFNHCLDTYFLLQSYSEKLHHLKRDYLNRILKQQKTDRDLYVQLDELTAICRSLKTDRSGAYVGLYRAEWAEKGYRTEIYRELLSEEVYLREKKAQDCWQLRLVPHYGFDQIYEHIYTKAYALWQSGECREDTLNIFRKAEEFQLRWWKLFISIKMNVSVRCRIEDEIRWIKEYFSEIRSWGEQYGCDTSCTTDTVWNSII